MRSNFGVPPPRLIEEMNSSVTIGPGFAADMHYVHQLLEINNSELAALEVSLVGAGFGTEFGTEDLKVLNYRQAMKAWDMDQWKDEIKNEYDRKVQCLHSSQEIRDASWSQANLYDMGIQA
jgi:hypothetical protein